MFCPGLIACVLQQRQRRGHGRDVLRRLAVLHVGRLHPVLPVHQQRRTATIPGLSNLTPDATASAIQSIGTLFFNISTGAALISNLSVQQEDRLIWAPDLFGSIAFLISVAIAFGLARRLSSSVEGRRAVWWEDAVNLAGSVAFGLFRIAAVVLPTTGEPLNVAIVERRNLHWSPVLSGWCDPGAERHRLCS